jgi:hypothetical protein
MGGIMKDSTIEKFASWLNLNDLHPTRLDAVFYSPLYTKNERSIRAKSCKCVDLRSLCKRIFKGAFYVLQEEYQTTGIPFLRTLDIKAGLLTENSYVCLSEESHKREKKTAVVSGDIVLAKTGASIGYSAVIPSWLHSANICQDLVGVRLVNSELSYFVQAFLSSKYGQVQALRWGQGNAHPHLGLDGIREWVIPIPKDDIVRVIGTMLQKAERLRHLAFRLKAEVVNEIEKHFKDVPVGTKRRAIWLQSKFLDDSRIDAGAHTADSIELESFLQKSRRFTQIKKLVQSVNDKAKFGSSDTIRYVEIGDISSTTNLASPNTLLGSDAPASAKKLVMHGDLLASTVRPNLKANGIVLTGDRDPIVASTALAVFRGDAPLIGFVCACLSTSTVNRQLVRWCSGSTYPVVDEQYMPEIYIPNIPTSEMNSLGDQWMLAMHQIRESQTLQNEAKLSICKLLEGT